MTNVLFLTADIGPAEGSVYSDLKRNGRKVFTYNVAGRWVPREGNAPLWMSGDKTRLSPMARNWFTRAIESKNIDFTISSGLHAGAFAANNLGGAFYPLLWRGNLDFGGSNETSTDAFADLLRTTDRLLLEDSWEMDKAVSKNSQVPHLQMRYPSPAARSYLTSTSGDVAIIYPRSKEQEAGVLREAAHGAFGGEIGIGLIEIKSLYRSGDLAKGLDFYNTLAHRLEKYSYAIILGTGPHHSTVIRALQHDKARLVVDQTVGMVFLSDELKLPHRARGLRCIQEMKKILETPNDSSISRGEPKHESPAGDFLETLNNLWHKDFDQHFEELPAVLDDGPLNIFFSVGTVQDLTKGARHQRVRNMHDEFFQRRSFNIFGQQPFMDRRLTLARTMLKAGRRAGVFYGENSTSPMTRVLNNYLANFLTEFSRLGGRSMWFVRDLHWLEKFEESPWTDAHVAKLKSDGIFELEEVGDRTDILAAPSGASGEGFNGLLVAAGEKERQWLPLPPAIQPQNIVDDTALVGVQGVTLLYAGGISEIYGMELYLSAIGGLDELTMIDFVVREPEAEPLKRELERLGLFESERIRILHTTMDLYHPRTSRTLGIILLDSKYAKFAFPYKTVTMIERGYPILCYSDMGIAEFVVSNDLGIAVERNVDSVREGIKTLIAEGAPGIQKARKTETWKSRVEQIFKILS